MSLLYEANENEQGLLTISFANKADYDKFREDDSIDTLGLTEFAPAKPLTLVLNHKDHSSDSTRVNHTYNEQQIERFKTSDGFNIIRKPFAA